MGRDTETSLAPGFRFHPTDEELVRYYLKRKVSSKPFRFDPISVVDIYKSEPWDLPSKSKLKSRDLEWYFFSALDRKYGSSLRTNRATERGYWKTTGKDRPVHQNSRTVGMKKTLVYHSGRAPHGARSNWVMHEYRLVDEELEKAGIAIDTFVLCRVFQKSGTGPKNGEQYGAPFIEEEWDDDVATFMHDEDAAVDKVVVGDGATDLDQDLEISIPSEKTPCPLNFYYGETSNYDDHCGDFIEVDQKPIIVRSETFEPRHDQQVADMPEQYEMDIKPINDDYFVELNNSMNPLEVNYSLNKPYLDDTDNPLLGDGLFLESNDLLDPAESDPAGFDMLDEYLTFLNSDDDVVFDPSEIVGSEQLVSDQAPLTQKHENGGTDLVYPESIHLSEAQGSNDASSSTQKLEATIYESDIKNPFIKRATDTMDSITAPPAFASEFPAKDAALHFHSAAQSSSSVHVTAGMIRIRNMTSTGNGTDWLLGKNVDINLIMPYSLLQGDINSAFLVAMTDLHAGKTSSVVLRSWFFLMLFWVLILSVSFKIASYIYINTNCDNKGELEQLFTTMTISGGDSEQLWEKRYKFIGVLLRNFY